MSGGGLAGSKVRCAKVTGCLVMTGRDRSVSLDELVPQPVVRAASKIQNTDDVRARKDGLRFYFAEKRGLGDEFVMGG
jgi:hypothetical protein